MNTIIILCSVFVIAPILSLWRREFLVFFILLVASQALGLIHEYSFGVKGYFDINSIIVIISAFAVLASFQRVGDLRKSIFVKYFVPILLLWSYGIIYPWAAGYSSLFYSIKASKAYMNFFCFFAVFLFIRNEKQINLSWTFIGWLAVYYSIFEILGNLSYGYVFSFFQYTYRPEQTIFHKVYLPVYTVMLIFFFLALYHLLFKMKKTRKVFSLIIYTLGVFLTFFRAYILGLCFVIPFILVMKGDKKKAIFSTSILISLIAVSLLILLTLSSGSKGYGNLFHSFVSSGIEELYYYRGGSLVGRDAVARGRKIIVEKKLWTGWGFLDKDSNMGKKLRPFVGAAGAGELGFVDKGYLDVVSKFGIIGCVILYGTFVLVFFRLIGLLKAEKSLDFQAKVFACAGCVLIFLCVQLTHADLTRQYGILPLSIIMGLIDREYMLLKCKQ